MTYTYRLAQPADLDRIMQIVADAQRFMAESGLDQWQDGYPQRELFVQDIEQDACRVCEADGRIAGMISLFFAAEADYAVVEGGNWLLGDIPYAAFHRVAVGADCRGGGIASRLISYCESLAREKGVKSLRGDTHRDNKAMRAMLEKNGFVHCGTIYLNGVRSETTARVCYEKALT
jgi:GNAT superfamily N-acetyltransferase